MRVFEISRKRRSVCFAGSVGRRGFNGLERLPDCVLPHGFAKADEVGWCNWGLRELKDGRALQIAHEPVDFNCDLGIGVTFAGGCDAFLIRRLFEPHCTGPQQCAKIVRAAKQWRKVLPMARVKIKPTGRAGHLIHDDVAARRISVAQSTIGDSAG